LVEYAKKCRGKTTEDSISRHLLPCGDRGNRYEAIFITDTDRNRFADALADSMRLSDYITVSHSRARLKAKLKSSRKLDKLYNQIKEQVIDLSISEIWPYNF